MPGDLVVRASGSSVTGKACCLAPQPAGEETEVPGRIDSPKVPQLHGAELGPLVFHQAPYTLPCSHPSHSSLCTTGSEGKWVMWVVASLQGFWTPVTQPLLDSCKERKFTTSLPPNSSLPRSAQPVSETPPERYLH